MSNSIIFFNIILLYILTTLAVDNKVKKPDLFVKKNFLIVNPRSPRDDLNALAGKNNNMEKCHHRQTCSLCLLRANSNCGWCLHQNKCNLKGDCPETYYDNNSWIQRDNGSCVKISELVPFQMPLSPVTPVEVIVEERLILKEPMFCIYSARNNTCFTKAKITPYGVKCDTPAKDMLPSIQTGEDDIKVKLSLSTTKLVFGEATLSLYDCRVHKTCTECVKSSYHCDWCIKKNLCTHSIGAECKNDILVSGVSKIGQSYRFGASYCPAINVSSDGSNEILVPFGVTKALKVTVSLHGYFMGHSEFVCRFSIDKRDLLVKAQLDGNTFNCGDVNFTYNSLAPNMTVPIQLLWDGSLLENIHNVKVVIYSCNYMAADCGACLDLPQKLRCGWCQESDQCEIRKQCPAPSTWVKDIRVDD